MSRFGACNVEVRNNLFNAYCTSYYCSPLWSLNHRNIECFCRTWRKCIRHVWKLHPQTRSVYLPLLTGQKPIIEQLMKRFIKFVCACINSDNTVLSLVSKLCAFSYSNIACNLKTVMSIIGIQTSAIFSEEIMLSECLLKLSKIEMNSDISNTISIIKELIMLRDGQATSILTPIEINELLTTICTL